MVIKHHYYESRFKKGNKICHVRSEYDGDYTSSVGTFTFCGYNPFPCFSMITNYKTVSDWLIANGWEREKYYSFRKVEDSYDNETGEVLSHCSESKIIDRR